IHPGREKGPAPEVRGLFRHPTKFLAGDASTYQDPLDIPGRCWDNHDMTTTQDSSEFEFLATTTWWMYTVDRSVWEEATLEVEGIDPAEEDEWEQVRWIGRVTIDALVDPDEMPFGGDVVVTG